MPSGGTLLRVLPRAVVVQNTSGEHTLRFGASLAPSKPVRRVSLEPVPVERRSLVSAVEDLPSLLKQVQIRPYRKNGQVFGYSVHQLSKDGIGRELGFQQGDVITHINGVAIDAKANGWELYEKLKDEPAVTVELIRQGIPLTVNYSLY